MAQITQEQYEKLAPYAASLKSAYKNSFVHVSGSDFIKIADIYAEVFGTPLRKGQMGCNTCRLNTLKKLGELYANYQAPKQEKKDTKRGRPKKLEEKVEKTEE